jgi:membrane protease subunit HflK
VITRFGKYTKTTQPGLNWRLPWPIEKRQVVNIAEFRSFEDRTRMLTQDEALVGINLAVQYRRADPVQFVFNVRDPEETLKEVSESAIREIIGQSKLDFVLEKGRQEISAKTKDLIQRTITSYNTGIEIISVNLQDVIVPEQVAPAQKDAIKAREDRDRANLAAQTYANDILPKARGLAASQLEAARAHRERVIAVADGESTRFAALAAEYNRAPEVTRRRLYLETMEQVMGSSAKVIVDTEGTGNMLYLPLDRLLEQRGQPRSGTVTVEPNSTLPLESPMDAAQSDLRSRGNR